MANRRTNREEWRKRVERWKGSGLTAEQFAAEMGSNAGKPLPAESATMPVSAVAAPESCPATSRPPSVPAAPPVPPPAPLWFAGPPPPQPVSAAQVQESRMTTRIRDREAMCSVLPREQPEAALTARNFPQDVLANGALGKTTRHGRLLESWFGNAISIVATSPGKKRVLWLARR